MKTVFPMAALLFAVLTVPTFAQEASPKDFEDFCKAWEGRWVGNVTWVADLPGFGEKGEKVTAYCDCKIAEDGHAMIANFYGGNGSATWIVFFDAGEKRIKGVWVTSGGIVNHATIYRKGEVWINEGRGSQPDGTKTEFMQTVTITDSGKTHTWTGTNTIGGKTANEQHDVWRRVNN